MADNRREGGLICILDLPLLDLQPGHQAQLRQVQLRLVIRGAQHLERRAIGERGGGRLGQANAVGI
jgi:hypothetical protein